MYVGKSEEQSSGKEKLLFYCHPMVTLQHLDSSEDLTDSHKCEQEKPQGH